MASTERGQWSNKLQFLLACIGCAVGFGSIWRFPYLAYENGGGIFLLPYLICSLIVGFPLFHLELSLGQFASLGPGKVFGILVPILQGLGWAMAMISILVAIYYNMIVGWVLAYLFETVTGRLRWSSCRNYWNTAGCMSTLENALCDAGRSNASSSSQIYYNFSCHTKEAFMAFNVSSMNVIEPAEEFFERYILNKSSSMESLGGLSTQLVIALFIAWTITALGLIKGVHSIGVITYFTATLPYLVIVVLFVRGVTLPGASIGLRYYLLDPDYSYLWKIETWRQAATQVCYTLGIGFGSLLALSSYNEFHHNSFRDALIVTLADGFFSVFGGSAIFAVLGFMSQNLNKDIKDVVQSGEGLAFIAYPEAISRMSLPWLWAALFFVMLLMLGMSSQFGLVQIVFTMLFDESRQLRKFRPFVVIAICFGLFLLGLPLCTQAGIFYFKILNDYAASYSVMLIVLLEIVATMYIYGANRFISDLRKMYDYPKNMFSKVFGATGWYIRWIWIVVAPILLVTICGLSLYYQIQTEMSYGKNERIYIYPSWATLLGWFISLLPILMLVGFAIYRIYENFRSKKHWRQLFAVQSRWCPAHEIDKRRTPTAPADTYRVYDTELNPSATSK